jgi:hypothetical protein
VKTVLGVSAFGLQDCVARPGAGCRQLGFYPTSAVLPTTPFGRILTGDEAYRERTHAGLPWPPEARIQPGEPVRRSPIAAVWRALVVAGDRMVRWDAGRGVSFSLARILASYLKALMMGNLPEQGPLPPGSARRESSALVVAIPNHLDEFGQELILRELAAMECPEPMLVWRPVAAALSWLAKVEGDFPTRMGENDHIHVICLSPDALEFTTFRLRVKEHNNQYYVLPLRDRPKRQPPLTGMDWAGRLIEENFAGIDEGAFWQAFIQFPEIWQALAGRPWNWDDLPRPWSQSGQWTLWDPEPDLCRHIYDTKAASCIPLREILKQSCEIDSDNALHGSISEVLLSEVQRMGKLFPGGRLRGMIICGPLAPRTIPPWLSSELEQLASRGLKVEGNLAEPEAGRLWLCAECDDPISEGAAIYGQRRLANIPSYLDTMPQISILAQEWGRLMWVPLLKAKEVLGGEEHKDRIEQRFQLDAGKRNLNVYLYKGPVDEAPNETQDIFDPQALPLGGVSPCRARLVREVVRRLGSLERVIQRLAGPQANQDIDYFRVDTQEGRYGRAFAETLFTGKGHEDAQSPEPFTVELARTPLRRATLDFPSAPERDTVLDIEVRIRPASGLAKIEILAEDASFLQGDRVLLNYSNMRFASSLPRRMRGWPRIEEIVVDPEDYVMRSRELWIKSFEATLPAAQEYIRVLDGLRNNVLKGSTRRLVAGLQLYVGAIDQDGLACTSTGNDLVLRISEKFERDFLALQSTRVPMPERYLSKVVSRAGWLFRATPPRIVEYLRRKLLEGYTSEGWKTAVEAASRAFVNVDDFRLLFSSIADLAGSGPLDNVDDNVDRTFPIYAARSVCNILMMRKDGEKGLVNCEMAQLFADRALKRLLKEQNKRPKPNFKMLYFQMIRLLFYLLRYRKTEPSSFDPNSPKSISVFEKAKESVMLAKEFFRGYPTKVRQIATIIDGFDKYLHYSGTEDVISVLRDLAEDDT